jgi:hypothetical protein
VLISLTFVLELRLGRLQQLQLPARQTIATNNKSSDKRDG